MTPKCCTDSVASMVFSRRLTGNDDFKEFLVLSSLIKICCVGVQYLPTYPLHSYVEHKARHRLLHFGLSFAIFSAAPQSLHPISHALLSFSMFPLVYPCFFSLLVSMSSAVLMLPFLSLLRIWLIYILLLMLISSSNLMVPVTFCSSLLLVVFGQ